MKFRSSHLAGCCALLLTFCAIFVTPATAAMRTVTATGEYTMGEAETMLVAKERALEDAKRRAAEQVGVYVTSSSTVEGLALTQDTVTTMTASFLRVTGTPSYTTEAVGDALAVTVRATITAEADDSDLQRIRQMTQEPSRVAAYQQLTASYARLQQEAAVLQKAFLAARTPEEKQEIKEALHKNEAAYQSYLLLQEAYAHPEKEAELLDRALTLYSANVPAYAARAAHRLGTDDLAGCLADTEAGRKALTAAMKKGEDADYSADDAHMMEFLMRGIAGSARFLQGNTDGALQDFRAADKLAEKFDLRTVRPDIYDHFLFDYGGAEILKEDYKTAETLYTRLIERLDVPAPKLPAPPVPPAGDTQAAQPAAAKGAPPATPEKERNLLHANAYLYRAIARSQQGNKEGAKKDLLQVQEVLQQLPKEDQQQVKEMLDALPSLQK
ncbi:MAG: hypothetical protein SPL62_03190 [Selenomonas sp.]|nr:hypothetical protein [Selenomonas sp.]